MTEVRVAPYQFALVILVTEVNLARVPRTPPRAGSGVGGNILEGERGGAVKGRLWRQGSGKGGSSRRAPRQRAPVSIPETPTWNY